MKILLSYSRMHFDPDLPESSQKFWNTSANILARTLYAQLSTIGELTYIDNREWERVRGQTFDLFIGIFPNFNTILSNCQIKKSIFWAVNFHPKERNRILRQFIRQSHLPKQALAGWDLLPARQIATSIKKADYILCVGNMSAYNSYVKWGVPAGKIKMLNYGLPDAPERYTPKHPGQTRRFLYVTSEVGLRKGFDLIFELFSTLSTASHDFHLDIVGPTTTPFYAQKLQQLQEKLGERLSFHDWIDASKTAYTELLKNNDIVLFPSLEEGQAGSVLDAISYGLVPIVSPESGIDFSPLGSFITHPGQTHNYAVLQKALSLPLDELKKLQQDSRAYYQEFHHKFGVPLEQCLHDCLNDKLYPKVSFVLPIFNKEATIASLLAFLDRVCQTYGNCELIIIFDGCKDRSEEIVRKFYRKNRGYQVHFKTSPNIFEVKSNNLGMKLATGKYVAVVQDDNYLYNPNLLFEAVNFLEKNEKTAILGGLAGVNYFPIGTKPESTGQSASTEHEVYQRQDATTDPELTNRVFEVDACMRGPLIFRKSFLEKEGYLDEIYTPLYQDDMDICMRAHHRGYRVYCMLMDVENKSFTMAAYDEKKWQFFSTIMNRNADIFYKRWSPPLQKSYGWLVRVPVFRTAKEQRQTNLRKRLIFNWLRSRQLGKAGLKRLHRVIRRTHS